jgi:hypothetical protein
MGVYFNGRYYIKPQVATYVDDTALTPVGLVGSNVIGMMGPAKDGIPNQAYLLTSLMDATDIFGEGPLVDGVAMAFNGGAQYIWATRVGGTYSATTHLFTSPPNQAIYEYNDSPNIPFRLLSKAYGFQANGIQVSTHRNADATKGIDVTVSAQGNVITGTGIYYNVLRIDNTSAETTFVIVTNATEYQLTITQGSNSGMLDLVGVSSTTDLVERIKEVMATAIPSPIDDTSFTFTVLKEIPGVQLDAGTTTVQSSGTLKANVRAVFDWFNSGFQPYVYAEDSRGIFTSYITKDSTLFAIQGNPLAVFTFNMALANLTGDMGYIDNTSYEGVLAEIYEDLDLDLVVPIVDDYLGNTIVLSADSIFNSVLSHCKAMSTIKSEERIGLVGYQFDGVGNITLTSDGDADTLTQLLINRAAVLNSPYMVVCAPRFKTFNIKGDLKFFNGTYTAAYIAGLIASFPVGEPITNKDISGIQALSTYFKNRQILQLIDNGVCTVERVGSALKVVQGVTSWISDDNFNKKEISVRLATNFVAKNCRDNLKTFIGRKNSPQILQIIKGSLVQILRELENNEIIVGTLAYPAYRNLVLTADGDVVRVSFECSPVLPINYILINIHATVFKATI